MFLKYLFYLLIISISLPANTNKYNYSILYNEIEVGIISDFSTIKSGYLIGKTKGLLKIILNKDHVVIYNSEIKPNLKLNKVYWKKDNNDILNMILLLKKEKVKNKTLKENEKYLIKVNCINSESCLFQKIYKTKNFISNGKLTFDNHNQILNIFKNGKILIKRKNN